MYRISWALAKPIPPSHLDPEHLLILDRNIHPDHLDIPGPGRRPGQRVVRPSAELGVTGVDQSMTGESRRVIAEGNVIHDGVVVLQGGLSIGVPAAAGGEAGRLVGAVLWVTVESGGIGRKFYSARAFVQTTGTPGAPYIF